MDETGAKAGQALDADDAQPQHEPDGVRAPKAGPPADSRKPHGDALGISGQPRPASGDAAPGDSPKRHGDPLEHVVRGSKA